MNDASTHLFPVLTGWAVGDGQAARDEVVLDVDDDDGGHGTHNLLNPVVPAVRELVLGHAAVLENGDEEKTFKFLPNIFLINYFF